MALRWVPTQLSGVPRQRFALPGSAEEAEKSWRRIRGAEKIELLLKGVTFKDGEAVQDNPPPQQNLAA
jgi:hypothetical protein